MGISLCISFVVFSFCFFVLCACFICSTSKEHTVQGRFSNENTSISNPNNIVKLTLRLLHMVCWYCQPKTQHATSRAGFSELLNLYKNNWRQLSSLQNPFYSLPERAVPLPVFSTSSSPSACSFLPLFCFFSRLCEYSPSPVLVTERGYIGALCPSCFPETLHHLPLSKADSLQLSPSYTWSVLDQSSCLGVWICIADQSAESASFLVLKFPKQQTLPQSWSKTQMWGWNLSSSWGECSCGLMLTVWDTRSEASPITDLSSQVSAATSEWTRWWWFFSPFLSPFLSQIWEPATALVHRKSHIWNECVIIDLLSIVGQ